MEREDYKQAVEDINAEFDRLLLCINTYNSKLLMSNVLRCAYNNGTSKGLSGDVLLKYCCNVLQNNINRMMQELPENKTKL